MTYSYKTTRTPVGVLKLVASDRGLAAVLWENDDPNRVRLAPLSEARNHCVLLEAEHQLLDYFAGKRRKFSLTFDFKGTGFQKEVWQALATIPFGSSSQARPEADIPPANASASAPAPQKVSKRLGPLIAPPVS